MNKHLANVKTFVKRNKGALIVGAILGAGVAFKILELDTKELVLIKKSHTFLEISPEIMDALATGTAMVYETAKGPLIVFAESK